MSYSKMLCRTWGTSSSGMHVIAQRCSTVAPQVRCLVQLTGHAYRKFATRHTDTLTGVAAHVVSSSDCMVAPSSPLQYPHRCVVEGALARDLGFVPGCPLPLLPLGTMSHRGRGRTECVGVHARRPSISRFGFVSSTRIKYNDCTKYRAKVGNLKCSVKR